MKRNNHRPLTAAGIVPRKPSYWAISRSPFYSFVFTLPFFAIYEMMTLFLSRDQLLTLRNGADALLRQFFAMFGIWGIHVLSIMFVIGFVVVFLWQKKKWRFTSVRGDYLLRMFAEGTAWGLVLYTILKFVPSLLMFPSGRVVSQQLVLAIGAGLYEEFLFRVVAINVVSLLLAAVFQWARLWRVSVAIIIAACLFSAFHFTGTFGESLVLTRFLYRAFAGLLLGILYVARGFGITAYAHIVYDFVVVFNITTAQA